MCLFAFKWNQDLETISPLPLSCFLCERKPYEPGLRETGTNIPQFCTLDTATLGSNSAYQDVFAFPISEV